ncbi:hypothetical protein HGRIS_001669 [Hohenbuehelia grisea]|uniref:Uncharacterized protein n=1 Tax=Hohenbuehelia grisea TaxID=104357 RepID=A0ABR3JJ31_9AGAR
MDLVFDSKDITNSPIRSRHDNAVQFSVLTIDGSDGKSTKIHYGQTADVAAVIYWNHRLFEIAGRQLSFTTTKAHPEGFFVSSESRVWRWDGPAYLVKYDSKWEAKLELEEEHVATFAPFKSHMFHDDEPAHITILPAAQRETVFFVMLFIYSECKRLEEAKDNKAAAKNFKAAARILDD